MPRSVLRLLALLTLLAGCGHGNDPRPSVVLILVDQLRQDAADRWLTETHRLAEQGVRFTDMRSVAPWTYPSVISLFSGLYPQQHGADASADGKRLTTFQESVPLLPRTLRAAGYDTAGFVTNPFLHEWNPLHEAFDHYDASFIGNQGPTRGHGKLVWTERMYSDSVNPAVRAYFDGRKKSAPEFVYVHYIDVHGRKESADRWLGAPFEGSYESAVRYVDGKIQELYDYFLARYDGNVVFLVTSDHGQDLDDDLLVGDGKPWRERKSSLHDFNLRIPLYLLPSKLVTTPRTIAEPCSNIDVVPTLLEWLEIEPEMALPGQSLLAALRGGEYHGGDRTLYARMSSMGRLEECVVHDERKLIRNRSPLGGTRVFDLRADPRETNNLADDATLRQLLERAADPRGIVFPASVEEVAPDIQDQLNALGYGGRTSQPAPVQLPAKKADTPAGSVEGRVHGVPREREFFVALARGGELLTLDVQRDQMPSLCELGADGHFRFPLVPAGTLELRVGTREELTSGRWTHHEELEVTGGATLVLDVKL